MTTLHEAAMRQALEALSTGLEYAEEKLIEHDQAYNQHPATKAGRGIITSDIQAINAAIEALRSALAQQERPKLNLDRQQVEPVTWRTEAAKWLRRKAVDQQAINEQYPRHVACYPSWEEKVRDLNWLADDLEREQEASPFGLDTPIAGAAPALAQQEPVAKVIPLSALGIAGIGLKHFGNPIPQAWYSAAKELTEILTTAPAPQAPQAQQPAKLNK